MMFLSDVEIKELTGYCRWADQRRWLQKRGWIYEVAASGRPIVLRIYVENRLGQLAESARKFAPNFESLRK